MKNVLKSNGSSLLGSISVNLCNFQDEIGLSDSRSERNRLINLIISKYANTIGELVDVANELELTKKYLYYKEVLGQSEFYSTKYSIDFNYDLSESKCDSIDIESSESPNMEGELIRKISIYKYHRRKHITIYLESTYETISKEEAMFRALSNLDLAELISVEQFLGIYVDIIISTFHSDVATELDYLKLRYYSLDQEGDVS